MSEQQKEPPKYGSPEHAAVRAQIQLHLSAAEAALAKAAEIAQENGVSFSWEGPSYGMGGYFSPKAWNSSSGSCGWTNDDEEGGWKASSQSC
jgi:hypothetical protein